MGCFYRVSVLFAGVRCGREWNVFGCGGVIGRVEYEKGSGGGGRALSRLEGACLGGGATKKSEKECKNKIKWTSHFAALILEWVEEWLVIGCSLSLLIYVWYSIRQFQTVSDSFRQISDRLSDRLSDRFQTVAQTV